MMQLEDWLDDLCVRFIVNIPAEELVSLERICFQIEEAQWFYEDFVRPLDPSLPSLSLKPFFQRVVPRCPTLMDWPEADMDTAFERFLKYKNRVPVRGAILLNDRMDEVLLVKGWKKNGTWSFPRGKINKDEDDLDCAVREAWEETGFDIKSAGLVTDPRRVRHIEKTIRSQNMKLFVFRDVPQDAHFEPQTRKEISKIQWFKLSDLPTEKRKTQQEGSGQQLVLNANKFYVVAPFMHDLKKLINAERKKDNRQSSRLAAPPLSVDAIDVELELSDIPTKTQDHLPMSPPMPSNLPEVTPLSATDALFNLKRQFNIVPPSQIEPVDTAAKSNALLALLRQGSATKMQTEPQALMEPTTFNVAQQMSPKQSTHHDYGMMNVKSPPPTFEHHQQMLPVAPPSSALPQLSQHTRSLLDAFNTPAMPQNPQVRARAQLPTDKQALLAAFSAQPSLSTTTPQAESAMGTQGTGLLQLLQRQLNKPAAMPENDLGATIDTAIAPVHITSPPAVNNLHAGHIDAPVTSNSLLDLLKGRSTSQHLQHPPQSHSAPVQRSEIISIAQTKQQSRLPPEPAELSAASDHDGKAQASIATKDALLSLLEAAPIKDAKPTQPKGRIGITAATLDRPIDQPQFDAITKASTLDNAIRREPPVTEKKLFDHRTGHVKQVTPMKVLAKQDDRSKMPKSPRNVKPKQVNSPRRPGTPKEPAKTFQPQILKRPQVLDDHTAPLQLNPKEAMVPTPKADSPTSLSMDEVVLGPLSPSANVPQPLEMPQSKMFSPPPQQSSQLLSPVHDPQREALLSLLKTPISKTTLPDADATPKAPCFTEQLPNQLVSPLLENSGSQELTRSRVSSLASTTGGLPKPSEKRQTAAGDKAFLMSYLKGFAAQETPLQQ